MIYAFEEYGLDVHRYELRYVDKPVKLEPQVFNILAYLIQHRDRVVTKEELLAQLWPGRLVTEATLTSRVTAARRAVGDRGQEQRVIQTIHGRGYRFIVPVEERLAREWASHDIPAAPPCTVTPSKDLRASRTVRAVGRETELEQLHHWLQQALRRSQDALTRARAQSHPFTLALTLAMVAVLRQMRQEADATLEHVQASLGLSSEHGFPYLGAIGTVRHGCGLARLGRVEEGIAQMRQALAALRATGTELSQPYHLALLAEAYGRGGQIEAGLWVLEEALVAAEQHAEHLYEAELQRLKGELLLNKSVAAGFIPAPTAIHNGPASSVGAAGLSSLRMQVQACFQTALDVARRQQAKSWELRAALSLSRLWQQQGKRAEALELLEPVYGWFTEGFDTADLQEAKALLDELS
ncbi:MAG TPA: winged helix-turn-helix domain-containing protein [Candidatus Tectomicrobia bacterium]|nr:winged helix-turn-helix domain-containing protein [Candidatus Tectomicrobia bacterium]